MALGDNIPLVAAFSLVEAYLLQRIVFEETTYHKVLLYTFIVTLMIQGFFSIIIYPLLLSPVRHLPKVPVGTAVRRITCSV